MSAEWQALQDRKFLPQNSSWLCGFHWPVSESPQSSPPSSPGHCHVSVGPLLSLTRISCLGPSWTRSDWRQLTDNRSSKSCLKITCHAQVSRRWSGVCFGGKPLFIPLQCENVFYSHINWWHTHLESYPTFKVCPALRYSVIKPGSAVTWPWMSYLVILAFRPH